MHSISAQKKRKQINGLGFVQNSSHFGLICVRNFNAVKIWGLVMNSYVQKDAGWKYKEVFVEHSFQKTCTNPGKCTLSITEGRGQNNNFALNFANVPSYKNKLVVERISYELNCSRDKAEELFDDTIKFLWAASQSDKDCLPTPAIDEAWHTFILFTKDYADFCETYCGKFMHHSPGGKGDNSAAVNILQPTIDLMYEKFGRKPSENWDYISVKSWRSENGSRSRVIEAS